MEKKEPVQSALSRRKLLKLAAYSVPAMSLVNMASVVRAGSLSPPVACDLPVGEGLRSYWYDYDGGNWEWEGIDVPCHGDPDHPWYPEEDDGTFMAHWWGLLVIRWPGDYKLRIRGADAAFGSMDVDGSSIPFGEGGMDVSFSACGLYDIEALYFYHVTEDPLSPSWVCFEWQTPGSGVWVPVPASELLEP